MKMIMVLSILGMPSIFQISTSMHTLEAVDRYLRMAFRFDESAEAEIQIIKPKRSAILKKLADKTPGCTAFTNPDKFLICRRKKTTLRPFRLRHIPHDWYKDERCIQTPPFIKLY